MSLPSSNTAVALPAPVLRPFIAHYAGFYAQALGPATHAGLPSRHIHLIISLGKPIEVLRMPRPGHYPATFPALVAGLQDAPAIVRHAGNLHGLHVFLTPLGARAVLHASASELSSRVIGLSDIWGRATGDLIERLQAAGTWQERFAILDAEFVRGLLPIAISRQLAWSWNRLAQTHGALAIQELARDLGWSRRHFSERFRAELGVTPKTAARIFRFERACRLIKDERPGLAEAACASGYHDQAHMTREWNALAGCTPKQWVAKELPIVQDYELAGSDHGRSRSTP